MQVDAVHMGTWYGKPPLAQLTFDLTIKNPASEARWFFVPGTIGSSGPGGLRGINVYGGLWQLEGMGGGWAVRVAGGATVTLARLSISSWHSPLPDSVSVPCVSASEITIGNEPIARFVDAEAKTQNGFVDGYIDRMRTKSDHRKEIEGTERPIGFTTKSDVALSVKIVAQPKRAITPWKPLMVGQLVTLEGKALDAKEGALLEGDGGSIWLEGIDGWPRGYYKGGDDGRRVRVTGVVIEKSDRPVFIDEPGAPQKAGIPVPAGTDLKKAARRLLLRNPVYTPID